MKTFHIFSFKSISFKDFPFLKAIIGGSLKISLISGWCCIMMYHFSIKTFLIFDAEGLVFCNKRQNVSDIFIFVFKSVHEKTRQEVIQLKLRPTLLKLGINVGFGE